jgi:hypothetical protein
MQLQYFLTLALPRQLKVRITIEVCRFTADAIDKLLRAVHFGCSGTKHILGGRIQRSVDRMKRFGRSERGEVAEER